MTTYPTTRKRKLRRVASKAQEAVTAPWRAEQWQAPVAAEGDEVQVVESVVAFEVAGHGDKLARLDRNGAQDVILF